MQNGTDNRRHITEPASGAAAVNDAHYTYDPGAVLPEGWSLVEVDLPEGWLGITDHSNREVTLATGLSPGQRRATLAHELEHVLRGPVDADAPSWHRGREEREVDVVASRKLITLEELVDKLLLTQDMNELAYELWVDLGMLQKRLERLTLADLRQVRNMLRARMMEDIFGTAPRTGDAAAEGGSDVA